MKTFWIHLQMSVFIKDYFCRLLQVKSDFQTTKSRADIEVSAASAEVAKARDQMQKSQDETVRGTICIVDI